MAKPTPAQIAAKQVARAAQKLNKTQQKKKPDWLKAHGHNQADGLTLDNEQAMLEAVLSLHGVTLDQYEEAL